MKKIIFIILILTIILIAGFAVYFWQINQQEDYLFAGVAYGAIAEISNDQIKLKIDNLNPAAELEENFNNFKIIKINRRTQFFSYSDKLKTEEQFYKEYNEFQNKLRQLEAEGQSIAGSEPPDWHEQEKIKLADLKVGQEINVYVRQSSKNQEPLMADKIVIEKNISAITDGQIIQGQTEENIEINATSGAIKEIKNNRISLELLNLDPTSTSTKKDLLDFIINNETKIYSRETKSQEQFNKEYAEFTDKLKKLDNVGKNTAGSEPPDWHEQEEIKLADLKVGQEISVFINEDVKTGELFFAKEIILINNNSKAIKTENSRLLDTDNDGLTDYEEKEIYFIDPNNPDTDNDGYSDGEEVRSGYNPKGDGKLE